MAPEERLEPTQIETQGSIAATSQPPAAAERADDGEPSVDLEDPSLYYNRELSWLDFNDRVLQLAEDSSVPLLERIKFCAIWEANLDEFFMVRVANLHDQVELGRDARGADGLSADEQIDAIADVVAAQRDRMARCFSGELVPSLAEHGIRFISVADASEDERRRDGAPLRGPDLPRTDAARDRARPPVSVHIQPLAEPGGDRSGPRPGDRGARARQGPEGASRPLRAARGGGGAVRRPRGRDRRQPGLALPGDGDRRPRPVPGHARHRLRRLRRGRRPARGGRGGASPPPLRRGGPPRGGERHEPAHPGPARGGVEDLRAAGVRGAEPARPLRPLGHRGHQRLRRPQLSPVRPCDSAAAPRRGGASPATSSRRCARPTFWFITPTTRSRPPSSASWSRRWRTPTCWPSSRPCTGRAPTRRSFRPSSRRPSAASRPCASSS